MSIHHPGSSEQPARKIAGRRANIGREVICKICQAAYAPAPTHVQLARAPHAVVESAFMSMCHFCFRCRRPACPSCWDEVHRICGSCVMEAQLAFRSSTPPLDGVLFPVVDDVPAARVHTLTPPLVCVRPGRFQQAPLPLETQTTIYLQTNSNQPIYDPSKRNLAPKASFSSSLPSAEPQHNRLNTAHRTHNPTADIPSWSPVHELDIEDIVTRPERRRVSQVQGQQPTQAKDIVHHTKKRRKPTKRQIQLERILTEAVSVIALLVILLVASAIFSANVNDGIANFLHVDIRAEIAYLLQLIQHLF